MFAPTYKLMYLDEWVAAGELPQAVLPRNGVSLLSQIQVIGHDDEQPVEADRMQELPPLEFHYTEFKPEEHDFFPFAGKDLPAQSLASPELALAGLFGNRLPDVFQMNGTVRYWRNLGNGTFDLPREMRDAPAGLQLADPSVQFIDANGDGRIDLLVTFEPVAGYFPTRPGWLWDRRSFQHYRQAPSFNLEDPEVQLVDLDGDGLQDIVLVYNGNVEYWPNLVYGDWDNRVSMRHTSRFPYGYDPKRILLGDVDGDKLAAIVYCDHCIKSERTYDAKHI